VIKDNEFGVYCLPKALESLAFLSRKFAQNRFFIKLAFLLRKPVLLYVGNDFVDVTVDGVKYRLLPNVNLSDKRLLTTPNLLDGKEREYFLKELPDGALVVDVGANIGGYSLQLAGARNDLRFICIEPNPSVLDRLKRNISYNEWTNKIEVMPFALGCEKGQLELNIDLDNEGQSSLVDNKIYNLQREIVQVDILFSLLKGYKLDEPWALKLDIEGGEFPALLGFFESCSEKSLWPTWIQIEQYKNTPLTEGVGYLLNLGYEQVLESRMNVILKKER